MNKIKKNLPIVALLLIIASCMLILNFATLISPDDYSYAMIIGGDDLKITSFSEVIKAVKYLYFSWTGRILPHILVGLFMTTSIPIFKILNSFMFILLIWIINRFITQKSTFLSILLAFGFFVYGTMFGEKFAWISGSLNYLWTAVPLIFYLYIFYGYFVEKRELKDWQKILFIQLGFFVGFLHEVTAFVGGAFLGVIFIFNIVRIWKSKNGYDKLFFITSIEFFVIGCMVTIFAPGNFIRNLTDSTEKGTVFACLGNYRDIKIQLLLVLLSMATIGILKQKELLKKEIIYFLLPVAIATIPFAYLGYFTPRSFVCYECLMIIVLSANVQFISEYFRTYKYYKKTMIILCMVFTVIIFQRFLPSIYGAGRYILPYKLKVTKQLETEQKEGNKDIVVSKFLFTDKICREKMINADNFFLDIGANAVANTYMALYYKFDAIHAISDIDYLIEIDTDITENVTYGILNKNTLELIQVVVASNKIIFSIPKEMLGTYVVDCRDKDLRSHVKSVRIRSVENEIQSPNIEQLINQPQ